MTTVSPKTLNELVDVLECRYRAALEKTMREPTRCYVSSHIVRAVAHEITAQTTIAVRNYNSDLSQPVLKINGLPVFQVIEENHVEVA